MARGKYTAERCKPKVRGAIIAKLAQGEPLTRIAIEAGVSNHTVYAVQNQESKDIAARKQRIAAQAALAATTAFDQLNERLTTEKIPTQMLVPIAGMATDKLALLAGDPQQIQVTVQHTHDLGRNLYDKLNQLASRQPVHAETVPLLGTGEDEQARSQ